MTPTATATLYEKHIRQQFPSVKVLALPGGTTDDPRLEAFLVPNDRSEEFVRFLLDDLPDQLAKEGVPFYGLIPHDERATRQYFPRVVRKKETTA